MRQMMEKQGVTEELKARDQMVWVGAVNKISVIFIKKFYILYPEIFIQRERQLKREWQNIKKQKRIFSTN